MLRIMGLVLIIPASLDLARASCKPAAFFPVRMRVRERGGAREGNFSSPLPGLSLCLYIHVLYIYIFTFFHCCMWKSIVLRRVPGRPLA